ncbi:hypothetical protein ACN38_g6480 [Penicillium nordicum]|uniref:Uncharacterized protein n=1 Tax=Penicillium nordicum TaxID=229535 RepID=A0A0M8NZW1_9EURO|nr:hypothetical protein ACN38_g6480 [Penicillium nordicum]
MERKLSEKATKIRRRLTFTKSSSVRGLESTQISPIEARLSSSRPRSATNPESPTHDEPTWDTRDTRDTGDTSDPDPLRGYSFTDEPGYFRPVSPFIDRQEIEEDLEADIKHACALLSHAIDRGIPAGLSYRSAMPLLTEGQNPAGQPGVDVAPSSLTQNAIPLSAPKQIKPETESTKRPYDNSVSRTNSSARFYNKQPSASPPHSASSESRLRSQSLATTIEVDNQRERSCSSSPVPFPYSPPQFNSEWPSKPTTLDSPVSSLNEIDTNTNTNANIPGTLSPVISPQDAPSLGGAGRTCVHASRDIQRPTDEKEPTATQAKKPKQVARFYSSCNQTIGESNSREWPNNFRDDRNSSIYSKASLPSSLGTGRGTMSRPETGNSKLGRTSTNEENSPGGYPRGVSHSASYLGDEYKHQERVTSVAMAGVPVKNNRRKKASSLLRKLTGLGTRKENDNENGVY